MTRASGRSAIVVGAIVIAASACGAGSESDTTAPSSTSSTIPTIDVFELEVGDCFDGLSIGRTERAEITSVRPARCEEPHDLEVFHAFAFTADGTYPGQDDVVGVADRGCAEAFVERLGENASLGQVVLWPTDRSWDGGDRVVLCAAFQRDGRKLVGHLP